MPEKWFIISAAFATIGLIFAYFGFLRKSYRLSKIALMWMAAAGIFLLIAVVSFVT